MAVAQSMRERSLTDTSFRIGGFRVALPRKAHDRRPLFDRTGRTGVIVPHPTTGGRSDGVDTRPESTTSSQVGVLESRLRDEARLEGVRLAAREIAHLLNNDLSVAVGFVDILQSEAALNPDLRILLESASISLDAAIRHIEQLQQVVRVVVKETPAGEALDLERSQRGVQ